LKVSIVFLNIKANKNGFDENFKTLGFKCKLKENVLSKAIKELEENKYLTRTRDKVKGRYKWFYKVTVRPNTTGLTVLQSPQNNRIENNQLKTDRYQYKKKEVKETNKIPPTPQGELDLKKVLQQRLKDLGVKAFNKLVNNHSLILIHNRLENIKKGASDNPFEIYEDITNGIAEPEDMLKELKSKSNQIEIDKIKPVLTAWRVQPGGSFEQMKLKLTSTILLEVKQITESGKAKNHESRFTDLRREKAVKACKITFDNLQFKFSDFMGIIREIYQDRKITLTPTERADLDEYQTAGVTLSLIEKTLSNLLNTEV